MHGLCALRLYSDYILYKRVFLFLFPGWHAGDQDDGKTLREIIRLELPRH
jgi:hypothetical protein